MKVKSGVTRIVFVFNSFVIKIPNYSISHLYFLYGCYANWSERNLWKNFKGCYWANSEEDVLDYVIPSLWCSWFGFIQIQSKAYPITDEEFQELKNNPSYKTIECDYKKENYGKYKGKIVCLDYP